MLTRNYYLVNKETRGVHFLFRLNSYFLSQDKNIAESWLAGRLYYSDPHFAMTLEELYALNYADEYDYASFDHPNGDAFQFIAEIHHASVKGYKLYYFKDLLQLHDFGGSDFIEINAFMATLFKEFIGPEEVERWSKDGWANFDDKYGVNELVMKHFTIESDEHEGIHLDGRLTDDYEWEGFKEI